MNEKKNEVTETRKPPRVLGIMLSSGCFTISLILNLVI